MFIVRLALTGSLLLATSTSRAADPGALVDAKHHLDRAVDAGSVSELLAARGDFDALAQAAPKEAALAYWVALADWRAVPLVSSTDRAEAERLCTDGLAACERALRLRPRFADALALEANLQGQSIVFAGGLAGLALASRMHEEYLQAEAMEPGNPRVALLHGIGVLFTPESAGGGASRAAPLFARAIEGAARETPSDSTAIDWGRADAEIWAGRCAATSGDWDAAIAHDRRALQLDPGNGWVRTRLLPEAESHRATGAQAR